MHNLIYTVSILILSISSLFGQGYDDISDFGVYQNDWALVLKDGLYGFIDTTGTEIIELCTMIFLLLGCTATIGHWF